MTDYILLAVVVYLWLIGGILLALALTDADLKGIPHWRIAALIYFWPVVAPYAAICSTVDMVVKQVKMWRMK